MKSLKNRRKKVIIVCAVALILLPLLAIEVYKLLTPATPVNPDISAGYTSFKNSLLEQPTPTSTPDEDEAAGPDSATPAIPDPATSVGPSYIDGILIVNKKYSLPRSYAPGEDPTAASAIRALIAAMRATGLSVSNSYSGYRSYDYQATLYANYVRAQGQAAADTFSAKPGHSEHQTGLAFDLRFATGKLITADSPEALWVASNAHTHGFIVRYPAGQDAITGYTHEPWHLRYIGPTASAIHASGLTLEEYLAVPGGDYLQL